MTINVTLELGEEFLSDVLTTAFDSQYGGCWYWALPRNQSLDQDAWEIDNDGKSVDDVWRSVWIVDREDATKTFKVTHELLAKGIARLFEPGVLPNRGDVRNAVLQQDAGAIDSEGADILVQLACFGETVYG